MAWISNLYAHHYHPAASSMPSTPAVHEATAVEVDSSVQRDSSGDLCRPTALPKPTRRTGKKRGRPIAEVGSIIAQATGLEHCATGGVPVASPPGGGTNPGRKSGRLREKGPTTYTSKGEIFRGGKRVNDDMYDQGPTKRARYNSTR